MTSLCHAGVLGLNDSKCLCPPSNKFCKEILNLPEEHTALLVVFVWYFCHTAGEGRSIHTKRADSPEDKRCLEHLCINVYPKSNDKIIPVENGSRA